MDTKELKEPFASAAAEYSRWWEAHQGEIETEEYEDTSPLFHYTDARGIEGIVRNREIWLSSIFHLNDPSELRYGIGIAREEVEKQCRNQLCLAVASQTFKVLDARVSKLFVFLVASFSRSGDELGQWRAYGDDGRGYSASMKRDALRDPSPGSPENFGNRALLARVVYDERVVRERQAETIARAFAALEAAQAKSRTELNKELDGLPQFLTEISSQLAISILWNSVTTKHPAYRMEEEERLIMVKRERDAFEGIETRIQGTVHVPFARLKFDSSNNDFLQSVIVGPAAPVGAVEGVAHLLRSVNSSSAATLHRSSIPYRSARR